MTITLTSTADSVMAPLAAEFRYHWEALQPGLDAIRPHQLGDGGLR